MAGGTINSRLLEVFPLIKRGLGQILGPFNKGSHVLHSPIIFRESVAFVVLTELAATLTEEIAA